MQDSKLKRELVYADKKYDVFGSIIYPPKTGEAIGIGSTDEEAHNTSHPNIKYFKKIDNTPPTTRNFIYAITKGEKKFLVHSTGHTDSGTYYIG